MKKIKLNENQIILFYNFLKSIREEGKPRNWSEWGEDWLLLCELELDFKKHIINNELDISDDSYFAVFNWLAHFTGDIKDSQKGEELFKDYSDLFIYLKDAYELYEPNESKYSAYLYIPKFYVDESPLKKIYVDPNKGVEQIFKNL